MPDTLLQPDTTRAIDRLPVSARLLVISFLLLVVAMGAAIWGEQQVTNYSRAVFDTERRELETLRMLSNLQDAELGQRSLLLTGNLEYLELYEEALSEIARARASFKALALEDEVARDRAEKLDSLISERLTPLALGIAAYRKGEAQTAIDGMKRGKGKALMDEIRAIVSEISAARMTVLSEQQARLASTTRWVHIAEAASAALFVLMAVFIFRQARASVEAQRRLRESQTEAVTAAMAANRAKSVFLATMSHELRTPMTAIVGMCDLLLAGNQNREERQVIHLLTRNAQTLLRLLNDILDLSKIEAGRLTFETVDFRISSVLEEVEALFAPVASQKGLVLAVAAMTGPKDVFRGDPKRLQQVLVNLIGNAIKFTTSGRVTVSNRQTAAPDGTTILEIEVEDTGEGISDEAMNRLFQEFEQEDISTSRRHGGSGLGLSISKRIIETLGGTIGATSTKGRGSCFFFSLPLAEGDPAKVAPRNAAHGVRAGSALDGLSLEILLAEDTPATQFLVGRMLSLWGHKVTTAGNGEEAVRLADRQRWDVILMDMQMPVMDGPQATRLIRAGNGPSAKVPIIALTADAIVENQHSYLEAGCNVVATKPIDWAELADHMAILLGRGESASEPIASRQAESEERGELPLLNLPLLDELSEALGGETVLALAASARANLRGYIEDLKQVVGEGNNRMALRIVHQIKGASAQVGAERLSGIARAIEIQGGGTAVEDVAPLEDCLVASSAAFDEYFARRTAA